MSISVVANDVARKSVEVSFSRAISAWHSDLSSSHSFLSCLKILRSDVASGMRFVWHRSARARTKTQNLNYFSIHFGSLFTHLSEIHSPTIALATVNTLQRASPSRPYIESAIESIPIHRSASFQPNRTSFQSPFRSWDSTVLLSESSKFLKIFDRMLWLPNVSSATSESLFFFPRETKVKLSVATEIRQGHQWSFASYNTSIQRSSKFRLIVENCLSMKWRLFYQKRKSTYYQLVGRRSQTLPQRLDQASSSPSS